MDNWTRKVMEAEKLSPEDTFRFVCDGCGKCCKNRGDILLNPYDIYRLRKYLKITFEELLDTYCEVYVGKASGLPIVRLRPSAVCVFLMHGKCLVQNAKPSVCVLYPLGRISEAVGDGVKYFLQDTGCGRRDQENTVADWLRNLGEEHEESTRLWHELVTTVAGFAHNMPVMKEEPLEKFRVILFGLLYDGYDCDKPFTPQIRSRQKIFMKLFRQLKGENDGQTDDDNRIL